MIKIVVQSADPAAPAGYMPGVPGTVGMANVPPKKGHF